MQKKGVFISYDTGVSWEAWNEGLTTLFAGTNSNNVVPPMVQSVDGRYIYFGTADSGVFRRKAVGTSMIVVTNAISKSSSTLAFFWSIPLFKIAFLSRKEKNFSYLNQKIIPYRI